MAVEDHGISTYERRRRAPLHFEARASNALTCARTLYEPHGIARYEGFVREGSLAIELIAKAVIAQRLDVGQTLDVTKVPVSHNVPKLWSSGKLPTLPPDDYGRLVQARVFLMWMGRYPAPNRDEDGERDGADLWEHAHERIPGSSLFRKPYVFNYEGVERIFSIAHRCFWDVRNGHAS